MRNGRSMLGVVAKATFCCVCAVVVVSCGEETSVDPPPPTEPTFSEQVDHILSDTLQSYGGKGVSAAILMPDSERYVAASGFSHDNIAITPQMLFSASSVTKTYVAALALQLAESGDLNLQDSLHQWLDNYQHVDSNITVRQLLNHTSGVFDFVQYPDAWATILHDPSRVWVPEEIIGSFVSEPYSAPGAELHYSNTGYLLIGMVIEAVTGTTVSSELRSRFWEPLGLTNTYFEVEETVTGTLAHAWITAGGGSLIDFSTVPRTAAYSASWTAGAVFTTAEDLAEWGRALYGGGVLADTMRAEMLSDPGTGMGLGTDLLLGPEFGSGEPVVGLVGSGLGYMAALAYMRDSNVSIAVMMNDNSLDCLLSMTSALVAAVTEHLL